MSSQTSAPLGELTERGLALYEQTLKSILDPAHSGEYVAIHVDSGDYEVARYSGDAMRAILKRRPIDGRLVIRKIGDEPEFGLEARIRAGEAQRARK